MTEFNVFEHFKKHPHNWKCIRIRIQKPYTYTTCVVYTKLYTVFNILIGVKKWLKKLLHIVLITRMKRSL